MELVKSAKKIVATALIVVVAAVSCVASQGVSMDSIPMMGGIMGGKK